MGSSLIGRFPGRVGDPAAGTCDCAERTGELVVFTCPVCIEKALVAIRALTDKGLLVRVDREGSVSALIGSGGSSA